MTNHYGGYMLNEVICSAEKMGIFETIGKEKTRDFVQEILRIGRLHGCNDGETLQGLGRLGICYSCLKETDDLKEGLCQDCR